jgi:ribosome-binding ATPase YchF (GTP1/OBG family)
LIARERAVHRTALPRILRSAWIRGAGPSGKDYVVQDGDILNFLFNV